MKIYTGNTIEIAYLYTHFNQVKTVPYERN